MMMLDIIKSLYKKKINLENISENVEFEVLMKSIIKWDVMPCSPAQVYRCFGATYCLHLHLRTNLVRERKFPIIEKYDGNIRGWYCIQGAPSSFRHRQIL
jgi:hypothetical protein